MSFIFAVGIIALFFGYFYLYFRVVGVKKRESSHSLAANKIPQKLPSPEPLSLAELEALTHHWMSKNQCQCTETQFINVNSIQISYQRSDPLFGTNFLVLLYICDAVQGEVPIEYLLQFRDCVRMMNMSKGFVITNGSFPSDTDRLFEEAPVVFLHVKDIQSHRTGVSQ